MRSSTLSVLDHDSVGKETKPATLVERGIELPRDYSSLYMNDIVYHHVEDIYPWVPFLRGKLLLHNGMNFLT